jgi:hypothetical protein
VDYPKIIGLTLAACNFVMGTYVVAELRASIGLWSYLMALISYAIGLLLWSEACRLRSLTEQELLFLPPIMLPRGGSTNLPQPPRPLARPSHVADLQGQRAADT